MGDIPVTLFMERASFEVIIVIGIITPRSIYRKKKTISQTQKKAHVIFI
jgi:hypothetical protein